MKIAIIGSGISGLVSALLLQSKHDVTVYEKNEALGGHANTVDINLNNQNNSVETGFIVLNDHNYPNFSSLLKYLNIETNKSSMSFSVSVDNGNFEYSSSYLGLIAQPKNLVDPLYWSMLRDVSYFYRNAIKDAEKGPEYETLGNFLIRCKYSKTFIEYHLLPMTASIWSCPKNLIINFPVKSLLSFFKNHNLLNLYDRPIWKTINGGSRSYIKAIVSRLKGPIQKKTKVNLISKGKNCIYVHTTKSKEKFDSIVLASHADQSLKIIDNSFKKQRNILSNFSFQNNTSILHTDINFMPKRKSVWSSWNYISNSDKSGNLSVTYWMNKLQKLNSPQSIFLSLNPKRLPNPDLILGQYSYSHPVFNQAAIEAQYKLERVQGEDNIWFCGAWTNYGFHEDGMVSALNIAEKFNIDIPWSKNQKEILHAAQ